MEIPNQPSVFADFVERLRFKDEAELKRLYTTLLKEELENEWRLITSKANFNEVREEDIIEAITKRRYKSDA